MIEKLINLAEIRFLPDFMVRYGINFFLRQKLKIEKNKFGYDLDINNDICSAFETKKDCINELIFILNKDLDFVSEIEEDAVFQIKWHTK